MTADFLVERGRATTNAGAPKYRVEGIWHEQLSQDERLRQPGGDRPLPVHLLQGYAKRAVRHAIVEQQEDGTWLATIAGFEGVWASEPSAIQALQVLEEVVFEWALLKIEDEDRDLPVLDDIDLNVL
jgi:UPF0150-like